jgi:hypothetical protein
MLIIFGQDLMSRLEGKLQSSETNYLELNSVVDELREQSKVVKLCDSLVASQAVRPLPNASAIPY